MVYMLGIHKELKMCLSNSNVTNIIFHIEILPLSWLIQQLLGKPRIFMGRDDLWTNQVHHYKRLEYSRTPLIRNGRESGLYFGLEGFSDMMG